MPCDGFWECLGNRSAQGREGLPPESGKDTDVCRSTRRRASSLLSRSPYWWQQPRQAHLLGIGIPTATPTGRFTSERTQAGAHRSESTCGSKNKVLNGTGRRNLYSRATSLSRPVVDRLMAALDDLDAPVED